MSYAAALAIQHFAVKAAAKSHGNVLKLGRARCGPDPNAAPVRACRELVKSCT